MKKRRILFLCTGNSCRSQMAEGWAKHNLATEFESFSAGVETHGMNQRAIKVMHEVGVDISSHRSENINAFDLHTFDCIITVCDNAHESCPITPPGCRVIHHSFDDPPRLSKDLENEEEILNCYRKVRDEIKEFVKHLPGLMASEGEQA